MPHRWQVDEIGVDVVQGCAGLAGAAGQARVGAAEGDPVVVVADAGTRRTTLVAAAQADPQRLSEGVRSFDDARLDQHLAHGHIQARDQRLNLLQTGRNVGDEDLAGGPDSSWSAIVLAFA